jgi:hypothetical protein
MAAPSHLVHTLLVEEWWITAMTIIKLTMDTLTLINVIAMKAVDQMEGLNQ